MAKEMKLINRDRFMELGITIAALRKVRGMTQEELAEKAGLSRSHLGSIEAPNLAYPFSLEMLFNIADALEIEPGDLLNLHLTSPNKNGKDGRAAK